MKEKAIEIFPSIEMSFNFEEIQIQILHKITNETKCSCYLHETIISALVFLLGERQYKIHKKLVFT